MNRLLSLPSSDVSSNRLNRHGERRMADDYVGLFEASVPDGFLEALVRGVERANRTAYQRAHRLFPDAQASNALPFLRWCSVDAELVAIARKFKLDATCP